MDNRQIMNVIILNGDGCELDSFNIVYTEEMERNGGVTVAQLSREDGFRRMSIQPGDQIVFGESESYFED